MPNRGNVVYDGSVSNTIVETAVTSKGPSIDKDVHDTSLASLLEAGTYYIADSVAQHVIGYPNETDLSKPSMLMVYKLPCGVYQELIMNVGDNGTMKRFFRTITDTAPSFNRIYTETDKPETVRYDEATKTLFVG